MGKGLYSYTFNEKILLVTPFEYSEDEVNTEWDIKSDHLYSKSTYPNGFMFESKSYVDKVIVKSNMKLVDNKDGTVSIADIA